MTMYVGCFLFRLDSPYDCNQWFRDLHPEIFEWAMDIAGDKWKLHITIPDDALETYIPVDVYIKYDEDRHMILHKLRWG